MPRPLNVRLARRGGSRYNGPRPCHFDARARSGHENIRRPVVLTAGTLTTTGNYAGAPPASMPYQTFIIDINGTKLDSANGVAVLPEPGTWALLGVGIAGMSVVALRCRTRAVRA